MMVIPMKDAGDKVVGAIQVINKKDNAMFSSTDLSHLKLTATYVSETIKSTLLLEEIDATQRELMHIIGIIGEERSEETALHVKRVSEYAYTLAMLIGLDDKECLMVRDASPLHDIGKIAIPDVVLNKPGEYTNQEREVMNQHVNLGYDMLKHSERGLLQVAATIVHEHHEKWDGSGYPRGLKGEQIHIYGRIVALADVFDALSCERIYKKSWEHDRVMAYLKTEKGKHFDPKLVDLLFENEDKFVHIKDKFKDVFGKYDNTCQSERSISVLGAYGTKSQKGGSSAFLIDAKTSIDAGNLIAPLGEKCIELESIWLTHSHLDHISDIAFIVDNYYERREKTLKIYALPETIEALQMHLFNHTIWPDFSNIPLANGQGMSLSYHPIVCGECYEVNEQLSIEPVDTDHTVASCGYVIHQGKASVLITADTLGLENIITRLNEDTDISTLVVECSFPSSMEKLAKESKHLTAKLLFSALENLNSKNIRIYINHIKPEYEKEIAQEIESLKGERSVTILKDGDSVNF
jgi:ribonuclease BN (tRNA processing enzyme)